MPLSPEARNLLGKISNSWPSQYRISPESLESIQDHPFKGELIALQDGGACSLPFYKTDRIHFLTIAPNVTEFNNEINLIRAWIIPSFAWERFEEGPGSSIITKNDPTRSISNAIFPLSPSGYFTWSTSLECGDRVFQKLRDKRALSEKIPKYSFHRSHHLSELREQFSIGMTTGDYDSAKDAIDIIHKHKLDHRAINIELMRIRLFDKCLSLIDAQFAMAETTLLKILFDICSHEDLLRYVLL